MSQQLADLRQGCTGAEKFSREAVPEDVSPLVRVATDAGALESGLGDHCDCASGGKADVRSKTAEEQPATRRLGATIAQVGDDGRADVWWDRHPRSLPALGANEHLARSPVDIVQGERRDLVGPQAELGQHHQDGVVPPPHDSCSVAAIEDLLNLPSREIGPQARELPSPDRGHAAGQSKRVQPPMMEVSEK